MDVVEPRGGYCGKAKLVADLCMWGDTNELGTPRPLESLIRCCSITASCTATMTAQCRLSRATWTLRCRPTVSCVD